jgi:hypothetical protein
MEKYKKMAIARHGDQQYYLSKLLSAKYLITYPNPEYTVKDEQKKCQILEIPNTKTCFITGNPSKGTGDHLYEINGYHRFTNKRGVNDLWNILPVCGTSNKTYKKFKFTLPDGTFVNKDIGYQDLTTDELLFLSQSTESYLISYALIYSKIKEWNEYVKSRNAIICYKEPDEFLEIRRKFKNNDKIKWEKTFEHIENVSI